MSLDSLPLFLTSIIFSYSQVAKTCLLNVLKEGFRSLWTDELENAWINAIEIVIGEMASGLRDGYESMANSAS